MNLERLTVKSQEALQAAQAGALELGHAEISPEHLLRALLTQGGGLGPVLLRWWRRGLAAPPTRWRG